MEDAPRNSADSCSDSRDRTIGCAILAPTHRRDRNKNSPDLSNPADRKWIIVNPDAIGYFRVLYEDPALISKLLAQLAEDHTAISPPSRGQLIDDGFALGFSGYTQLEQALEFTKYLDKETEYNVWVAVFSNFRKFLRLFAATPAYETLRAYLGARIRTALKRVGYEQPSEERGIPILARAHLLGFATILDEEESLKYSAKLFERWREAPPDSSGIPADLQNSVYCGAVKSDPTGSAWRHVHEEYLLEQFDGLRKRSLLNALSCTTDREFLKQLMEGATAPVTRSTTTGASDPHPLQFGDDWYELSPSIVYANLASSSVASRAFLVEHLHEKLQGVVTSPLSNGEAAESKDTNLPPVVSIISTLSQYLHSEEEFSKVNWKL